MWKTWFLTDAAVMESSPGGTVAGRVLDGPERPRHHASTIDRGWAKMEAGAIPARPRHCERSETRLGTSAQMPLGVNPWEGEIDGLEPGDLAHLAPM